MSIYKEYFDKIKEITKNCTFVRGVFEIGRDSDNRLVFNGFDDYCIFESSSNYNDDLMKDAFINDFICEVEKEGLYEIEALLSYCAEETDLFPPVVTCQAYYLIEHIEYKFMHEIQKEKPTKELGLGVMLF